MDTRESKDSISSLPDDLICHILSFLSIKDAALTSILSTRWRFLFAFVPNLDLDTSIIDSTGMRVRIPMSQSFKDFVDRVVALQGNAPLNKFSLRCDISPISDHPHVSGWILNVLQRGIIELVLDFSRYGDYQFSFLMSSTLVKLKLAGTCDFNINMKQVFLPKLKVLHLRDVVFVYDFSMLMSGCDALEELVMFNVIASGQSFYVPNPNLKSVTMHREQVPPIVRNLLFETSNLVYLEYTATILANFPRGNFDLLVEARIDLRLEDDFNHTLSMIGKTTAFIMLIRNVKILYLSSHTLEVLALRRNAKPAFKYKDMPVFINLLHLTIETFQEVVWEALPNLLKNCPNLETLVFKGLHYKDTNQCGNLRYRFKDTSKCYENRCVCKPWEGTPIWLSSSSVKMLKVLKFGEITDDMDKQVAMIEYLVETMPNLEEIILYYDTPNDDDLRRLSTGFQKLVKVASSKCKIQVISKTINFSSTSELVIDGHPAIFQ